MITAWLHEEIIQKNNTMRKLDPVLLIKTGFVTDQYPAVPVSKKIKPFQKKILRSYSKPYYENKTSVSL